tara:strand:- start:3147 stop:3485 length:339 start_codon:yes stop_codon:yes gene_type:complete
MTNRAKQKGTQFETAVARFLSEETGAWVERRALSGTADKGDLIGDGALADWCLEVKNHKAIDLASFVDQAEAEARNAGSKWFAAIVKRRNKNVKESYVVMPLWMWTELICDE